MSSKIKEIWISKTPSLIRLYTGIGFDGKQHQRRSVQSLMLLDNIHDFGHDRKGYDSHLMDGFCDTKEYGSFDGGEFSCIFTLILKKLNQISMIFSTNGKKNIFTYEMFKIVGWEKFFLTILHDKTTNIKTIPKSSWKTFSILRCWSRDTTKKQHESIKTFLKDNSNYTSLATSHFDACGGTCEDFDETVKNSPPGSILFELPFPTGKDNVMYKYDPKQGILQRKFPKKYGRGTVFNELLEDGRECICTKGDETIDCIPIAPGSTMRRCFYRRVDKLSVDDYKGKSVVPQDSIQKVASELYKYLDYKYPGGGTKASFNDIEFFLTAKALSDMAQCSEAKLRNCYLLTQDTMQLIIGCKLGTQMIDYGGKKGTVTLSDSSIVAYIYDIEKFLKKKGIEMPPISVLKSEDTVDKYIKKVEIALDKPSYKKDSEFIGFCLKCIFYLLYYFAIKGFYWTKKGVLFFGKNKEKIE